MRPNYPFSLAQSVEQPAAVGCRPPGLTVRRASALILGCGALDEGENQATDGWREGRSPASEKFYWRPVALTQKALA